MTMRILTNCPHSEDGWCLSCVKELFEEGTVKVNTVELSRQLVVAIEGTRIPVGEVATIEFIDAVCPVLIGPGLSSDRTIDFVPDDTVTTELKITCVSRRARG